MSAYEAIKSALKTGILVTCPCQSPWAGNYRKSDFSSTTENHCRIARDPRGIVGFLPNRPVPRTNGRPSTSTSSLVSWRCLEVGGWKTNFSQCFAANSPTSCLEQFSCLSDWQLVPLPQSVGGAAYASLSG